MFDNPLAGVNQLNSYLAKKTEEEKQKKIKQQFQNTMQAKPTASLVQQNLDQFMANPIETEVKPALEKAREPFSPSQKYSGINKKQERFIETTAKNDNEKDNIYMEIIRAKDDKSFLDERVATRQNLMQQFVKSTDKTEKNTLLQTIKLGQLGDTLRKTAFDKGIFGVKDKSDQELLNSLGIGQDTNKQKALEDFFNDKIDAPTALNRMGISEIQATEIEKEQPKGTILGDIAGGISKSGTATAEIGADIGDWLGYNIIKATMGEEKANEAKKKMGAKFGETINNALQTAGVNTDSFSFKAGKFVGDAAQMAAAGSAIKSIGAIEKATQAIDTIGATSKGAKVVTSIAKGAIQGATDTAMYDAIANKEVASGKEIAIGGAIGGAATALSLGISKTIDAIKNKLQLSGTLNVKDLRKAAKTVGNEKDVDNVAQWMLNRKVVGSHETMVERLTNIADDSFSKTNKALSASKSEYKVPSAEAALEKMKKALGGDEAIGGLENEFDEITKLLDKSKRSGLSLMELNKIQKLQSNYLPNFTTSNTIADTVQAKGNANLYMKVKKFIEEMAAKEGLGNIKEMKKTTQLANLLKEAIGKKASNESARSLVNLYGPSGVGVVGGALSGPNPMEDPIGFIKNVAIGGLVGGVIQNKAVQSNVASFINKLTPQEASVVAQLINGAMRGGVAEVSTDEETTD